METNHLKEIFDWVNKNGLTRFGNLKGTSMFKVDNASYEYLEGEKTLKIHYEDNKTSTLKEIMFHSDTFDVEVTKTPKSVTLNVKMKDAGDDPLPFLITFERQEQKLSDFYSNNEYQKGIEQIWWKKKAKDITLDTGYYLEVYVNDDGVDSGTANGSSTWFYIDKETSMSALFEYFEGEGSIKDDTLTIILIPSLDEGYERERGFAEPISTLIA